MEEFKVISVKDNIAYTNEYDETAYEEFIRYKPDYKIMEMDWIRLFKDAVRSFILNTESIMQTNIFDEEKTNYIIEKSAEYAILYFNSGHDERILRIFKGVLTDIIRGYSYQQNMYTKIINQLYAGIVKLIEV